MNHGRPIGTTKGPGDSTSEFTAIAPDPMQQAKFGEFVYFRDHGIAGESGDLWAHKGPTGRALVAGRIHGQPRD